MKCPSCNSSRYKEGVCKKCGFRNDPNYLKMKLICKVPNCSKQAYNGQEGYCYEHYEKLLKLRKDKLVTTQCK